MAEGGSVGKHRRIKEDMQRPPLSSSLVNALRDPAAWGVYLLAFVSTFAAALPQTNGALDAADYAAHAVLIPAWRDVAYPGWHFVGHVISIALSCGPLVAAALASSLFAVLTAVAMRWMGRLLTPDADDAILDFITVVLMFVGPLYFPQFKEHYVVGTGTPNTWHNPTNNAVKPFAIICLMMYSYLVETRGAKGGFRRFATWVVFALLLLVSTICKPSFLQVFLPTVATYTICSVIHTRGESLKFGIASFLACIPSLLPFFIQFFTYFGGNNSGGGMAIEPFVVWHTYTPSVVYSIICALALPLLVMLMRIGKIGDDPMFVLSMLTAAYGVVEYILFVETGPAKLYGNFGWGWLVGCTLMWYVAGFRYMDMASGWKGQGHIRKALLFVCLILLFGHFSLGFAYYLKVVSIGVFSGNMAI